MDYSHEPYSVRDTGEQIAQFSAKYAAVRAEIMKDIVGQEEVVDGVLIALIAGGNVLLEGVPGVGKTRLVRSVGRALNLSFSRIQFTPDLMPADVTGANIIEKDESGRNVQRFVGGPVFANIVLADEINRATPKTQSALLEAMQEHRVTAGGRTWLLPEPFFVLATQNPIEQDGTYALPEAQTDRFLFKLEMTFPSPEELRSIVLMTQETQEERAETVLTGEDLLAMRETAKAVPALDDVLMYAVRLVTATHPESEDAPETARDEIRFGASPRAAQALITCAKIRALTEGRYNISYDDINALAQPVLRHRVKLTYDAVMRRRTPDQVIEALIAELNGKKPKRAGTEKAADAGSAEKKLFGRA